MDDISRALAYEVKKEIADRYFGFRRTIEKDTEVYLKKIVKTALELEQNVGFDLTRIYSLLKEDAFIDDFRQLTQLTDNFFFDSYIKSSPTIRKRVFCNTKIHGLTSKKRYKNLFFDTYRELYRHLLHYNEKLSELSEEYDVLCEEIKLFYQKNDISLIMQFFRNIDNQSVNDFGAQVRDFADPQDLEKKLRILPPIPAKTQLPQINRILRLSTIKRDLNKLLEKCYCAQNGCDPRDFFTVDKQP